MYLIFPDGSRIKRALWQNISSLKKGGMRPIRVELTGDELEQIIIEPKEEDIVNYLFTGATKQNWVYYNLLSVLDRSIVEEAGQ